MLLKRTIFFFLLACTLAFSWNTAHAASKYQIQIGSAKNIEGTRFFAAKASRILNTSTYIIKLGVFYAVVVGDYATKEKAREALLRVKKHYNAMVVSYDDMELLAVYSDGKDISRKGLKTLSDSKTTETVKKKPVRKVKHTEVNALNKKLATMVANVKVKDCVLRSKETVDNYTFTSSVNLKNIDPDSAATEEKHGGKLYITFKTANMSTIRVQQLVDDAVMYERNDTHLTLRAVRKDENSVHKTLTSLREMIAYCKKVQKATPTKKPRRKKKK